MQLWLHYLSLPFAGWCFTHQYKNTTQFYFYAGPVVPQNTKAKKLNRNYGNMSGETIEKSLKMVFEQSDAGSIILGFFFNSGVHTVFGFKYDTQKYGYVESMSWNCQEHHYLVYSNGVYTFTSAQKKYHSEIAERINRYQKPTVVLLPAINEVQLQDIYPSSTQKRNP